MDNNHTQLHFCKIAPTERLPGLQESSTISRWRTRKQGITIEREPRACLMFESSASPAERSQSFYLRSNELKPQTRYSHALYWVLYPTRSPRPAGSGSLWPSLFARVPANKPQAAADNYTWSCTRLSYTEILSGAKSRNPKRKIFMDYFFCGIMHRVSECRN